MDAAFPSSIEGATWNGAFYPLIFAVNAISGGSSSDHALFDKLLKALADSSMDEIEGTSRNESLNFANALDSRARRQISLFRPDEDDEADDSSIEDNFLEAPYVVASGSKRAGARSNPTGNFVNFGSLRSGTTVGANSNNASNIGSLPTGNSINSISSTSATPNAIGTIPFGANSISSDGKSIMMAYAKTLDTLRQKNNFFQYARIVPVSSRYGFPPSKDPSGMQNLAYSLPAALHQLNRRRMQPLTHIEEKEEYIQSVLSEYKTSLSGILPSGWFDKHVHALPSVILVVCTVCSNRSEQSMQDNHLYETVEHLQYSLVPKRRCPIQIVALVRNDVTALQADSWNMAVMNELIEKTATISNNMIDESGNNISGAVGSSEAQPQVSIQLLHAVNDLEVSIRASVALKRLHRATRNASLLYYLRQARRTREKLLKLVSANEESISNNNSIMMRRNKAQPQIASPHMGLSPIIVRYCIKIALFYEFQMARNEKSILFLVEAYRVVMKYYQFLLQNDSNNIVDNDDASIDSGDQTLTPSVLGTLSTDSNTEAEGLEVEFVTDSLVSSKSPTSRKSAGTNVKFRWTTLLPSPPEDMIHQCRAVADWLNAKLIKVSLTSQTDAGLMAVTKQWRLHTRTFCTAFNARPNRQPQNADGSDYFWYNWLCIVRQRRSMCHLLEKHRPRRGSISEGSSSDRNELGSTSSSDEIELMFSFWRNYLSAAEAMLRLGREIRRRIQQHQDKQTNLGSPKIPDEQSIIQVDNNFAGLSSRKDAFLRQRYLGGGIGMDSFEDEFELECQINHLERALELILTAIAYFEEELQSEKRGFYAEDSYSELCSSRTGARMYYLAGGILLGMDRHEQAATHLVKAAKYAKGWRELELAIRRMLIECYEKHFPSQDSNYRHTSDSNENSETLVSMILDSYFNAEMSSQDLRRALSHFASMYGGETLKWYHATTGEESTNSLPFSFAVSFPGKTHATAGDTVYASIMIKSNLDYAVHVNSVLLKTLAGNLPIAQMDLLSAMNASEGSEGGIIIQAQTAIIISTNVKLPRDLSKIASDDSGNGGEQSGVAGKGSFAKSARPRTAGITAAGGARLVSEDMLSKGNRSSQGWNVRYLGGKPLLCDGIQLVFHPVQAEVATSGNAESVTLIELTIEKKSSRTAANIKRTPFEEENYISSAWSRPLNLPLTRGPRSIRVLSPQPQLLVTNITEEITHGCALEGTVNRLFFKLQAGLQERCSNIKIAVSCFSVLVSPSGAINRLVSEDALKSETENSFDLTRPCFRTPSIVAHTSSSTLPILSDFGYQLPIGWSLAGTGQGHNYVCTETLKEGESTLLHLDLFRPATINTCQKELYSVNDSIEIEDLADFCQCKTDYYLTITYQQERPSALKQKIMKRSIRRKPLAMRGKSDGSANANQEMNIGMEIESLDFSDEVSLEKMGTAVWTSPISAQFSSGARLWNPSGIRNFANVMGTSGKSELQHSKANPQLNLPMPLIATRTGSTVDIAKNNARVSLNQHGHEGQPGSNAEGLVLYDGECITSQCTLHLDPSIDGLEAEIVSVRFEDNHTSSASASFSLLSNNVYSDDNMTIYRSTIDDPSRILTAGSKFCVNYPVRATVTNTSSAGRISTSLGNLLVDWLPSTLDLPADLKTLECRSVGGIKGHGPLALVSPTTIRFKGPLCQFDVAPFEVERFLIKSDVSVGNPFEVSYGIKNKTSMHQGLLVHFGSDPSSFTGNGLLMTGSMNGEVVLSPFEQHIVSFTFLPTRPGVMHFPALHVVSERCNSWAVDSGHSSNRIFVMP